MPAGDGDTYSIPEVGAALAVAGEVECSVTGAGAARVPASDDATNLITGSGAAWAAAGSGATDSLADVGAA